MQTLGQLRAGIRHDLKGPLNKGQGHAHFQRKLLCARSALPIESCIQYQIWSL